MGVVGGAGGADAFLSLPSSYNATGKPVYDFCVGRTYMNAFSPNSSIARSVWPTGKVMRGEGGRRVRAWPSSPV